MKKKERIAELEHQLAIVSNELFACSGQLKHELEKLNRFTPMWQQTFDRYRGEIEIAQAKLRKREEP
jgi:predicted secreted Zn-dependent protease